MEVRVRSAKEWLQKMQEAVRGGQDAVSYDDPIRRMFGFVSGVFESEQRVVIGLSDLKNTMNDLDDLGVDATVLRDCFRTPEGRARLPVLLRG